MIAEEERVLEMVDAAADHARLWVRDGDLGDLSADQARAIRNIAVSPFLVQPLQAPAGAGKTHSLKALRAAAHHARTRVPTPRQGQAAVGWAPTRPGCIPR